ncbi:amidohydrolase family protein [Reyranella sp.]|uniref:metal-dependent hydrolase family protein n=1 Tax=Reyranella sp. TaxID=1929291 RepID=UPI003D0F0AFF
MSQILFRNFSLLDPRWDEARGGYEVLIEGGTIKEVSRQPIKAHEARVIDGGKRTLMPGLIDCHVHVFLTEVNIRHLEAIPLTLLTAKSAELMRGMLNRGFTTVRDTGGADWGIKTAVESGLIPGPRLFISAKAIGPTGGHSDSRRRTDYQPASCGCCNGMVYVMAVADGADEVRKCVREQMRQGADQVKIMCSGGVASPYDPLDSLQFSEAEIAAATDEARNFGRYVLAHAYTPEAITRAMNNGVRTIEHGNLIDDTSAALIRSKGGYMIANLVTYFSMKERAAQFGMTAEMLAKNDIVLDGALRSLEICKRAGVKVGYGTDLLGALQVDQSLEFIHRAKVLSPLEIIRQATLVGAEIVQQEGKLGVVEPGAHADLIAIDGDPVKNLELFLGEGKHMPMIMKGGKFHKNALK